VAIIALALALLAPVAAADERAGWRWPVAGPVVSTFRYGSDPFARGQRRGIRIGAPLGTPVRSACAGRVRFAGSVGTSGQTISVACGGYVATYLHLSSLRVAAGDEVRQGERLARVGRSGRPALGAAHLAFGIYVARRRWAYIDPLTLLARRRGSPPALLPLLDRRTRPPPGIGRAPEPEAPRPTVEAPRRRERAWRDAPRRATSEWDATQREHPARESTAPSLPILTWFGLGALAAALVAAPAGRARRRRLRAAVTGVQPSSR